MTSPNYGLVCRKIQVNILGFWRSQTFNFYAIFQQENATKHQPLGPKKCPPRNEDALERERKETAKRTLELMEARRMVEVAMEGENAKKCLGPVNFFLACFFWVLVTNCPKWLCLFCGVSIGVICNLHLGWSGKICFNFFGWIGNKVFFWFMATQEEPQEEHCQQALQCALGEATWCRSRDRSCWWLKSG